MAGFPRRLQWSFKYEKEVRSLRARLAPNVATITILLMTQTVDTLSNIELDHVKAVQELDNKVSLRSMTLAKLEQAASDMATAQGTLEAGQSRLAAAAAIQHHKLHSLKSKTDKLLSITAVQERLMLDQAGVLEGIRDTGTAVNVRSQEINDTVSTIRQDTEEIKNKIPSLLQQVLNIMNVVTAGISKAREIARLLRKTTRLITQFTVEMRECMQRLLLTFSDIHRLLIRLEHLLPRHIDLPIVRFRDAFNSMRAFPFDLCREWRTFQKLVILVFSNQQGLHRIHNGQFYVTNARIGRRLNPVFWHNAVQPNDELAMTMVIDDLEAEDGFCPFKSCGMSTKDAPSHGGGKVCPNCFRFAAVSQKRSILSPNRLLHETIALDEEASASSLPPEPISYTFTKSRDFNIKSTHARGPTKHVSNTEDIELYHSIEVFRALLDSSRDVSLPSVSNTLKSNMHIFIRNLARKSRIIRVSPLYTIERLKDIIYEKERVPQAEQRLIFAGKRLEDERSLSEYGIQKDNTIHLVAGLRSTLIFNSGTRKTEKNDDAKFEEALPTSKIEIRVALLEGKVISLHVRKSWRLRELVKIIDGLVKWVEDVHLTHNDHRLSDDDKSLHEYGIVNHDILELPVKMRSRRKLKSYTNHQEGDPSLNRSPYVRLLKDPLYKASISKSTPLDCGQEKHIAVLLRGPYLCVVPLILKPWDTVGSIKQIVQMRTKVPTVNQRLIALGIVLDDSKSFLDYGFGDTADIWIVFRRESRWGAPDERIYV